MSAHHDADDRRTADNGPHDCDDCGTTVEESADRTSWSWLCEDCHQARDDNRKRHRRLVESRRESVHGAPQEDVEAKVVYESNRSGEAVEAVVSVDYIEGRHPEEDPAALYFKGYDERRDRDLHIWVGGSYDPDDPRYQGDGYEPPEVWSESYVRQGDGHTRRRTTLGEPVAVYFPRGHSFRVEIEGTTDDEAERIQKEVRKAAEKAANRLRSSGSARAEATVDGPEILERADLTEGDR